MRMETWSVSGSGEIVQRMRRCCLGQKTSVWLAILARRCAELCRWSRSLGRHVPAKGTLEVGSVVDGGGRIQPGTGLLMQVRRDGGRGTRPDNDE